MTPHKPLRCAGLMPHTNDTCCARVSCPIQTTLAVRGSHDPAQTSLSFWTATNPRPKFRQGKGWRVAAYIPDETARLSSLSSSQYFPDDVDVHLREWDRDTRRI